MVEPVPGVTTSVAGGMVGPGGLASCVNSFRISAVMERLASHLRPNPLDNPSEFFNLCLSLSRGIDYALANDEVPSKAQELPLLLQQICRRKNDFLLQAAIMVLMISVRNACKIGWFSDKDNVELLALADEIGSHFGSPGAVSTEPNQSLTAIMASVAWLCLLGLHKPFTYERTDVSVKDCQIVASLDVKPGYGAYILDFHISKKSIVPHHEKIRLLVAQTDNVEKSSCLVTPQQVDFLINGKSVERRTNVFMDTGPQMPTNVTAMLKYGTNLLQAVGQFNGHYIIILAYMSVKPSVDVSVIHDYVQPALVAPESDSDIIEGPSRISLNCPISFTRIKTAVKGSSCKHHQCFDFSNFIKINLRRPSWRCPHCYQYVCYLDIRIDQNMAKILKEVDMNVTDVTISADGTWEVVKSNDEGNQAEDKTTSCQKEGSEQKGSTGIDTLPSLLDLTNDDDMLDAPGACEIDKKPFEFNVQSESVSPNPTMMIQQSSMIEMAQDVGSHLENGVWSTGQFMSASLGGTSNGSVATTSGSLALSSMTTPVLTDAVSAMSNREAMGDRNTSLMAPGVQLSDATNLQLQFLNSVVNDEYGRVSSIPRHLNRTPIAIQALPVQPNTSGSQQRSRTATNSLISSSSSLPSQTVPPVTPSMDGAGRVNSNLGRQQQLSRSHMTPLRPPNPVSSQLPPAPSQIRSHRSLTVVPGQSVQQVVGQAGPSQIPGQRGAAPGMLTSFRNPHLQQALNARMPQFTSQSPNMIPSLSQPRAPIQQVATHVGVSSRAGAGVNHRTGLPQSAGMGRRSPSLAVPNQTSRVELSSPVTASSIRSPGLPSGDAGDLPSQQNWRPAGRMRGALSGEAYSAALRQFMISPTQPSQASGTATNQPAGSSGRSS